MLLFLLFTLIFLSPFDAHAASCNDVRNANDEVICAKTQYEAAQKNLSNIFKQLTELKASAQQDEKDSVTELADLKEAQKQWVLYRNLACESGLGSQLERYSCLLSLTEDRIDILEDIYLLKGETEGLSRKETLPSWLNALGYDHPNYFWDMSYSTEVDMNCDSILETIVYGVTSENGTVVPSFAVVNHPKNGRSTSHVLSILNISENSENICWAQRPEYVHEIVQVKEPASTGKVENYDYQFFSRSFPFPKAKPEKGACVVNLIAKRGHCSSYIINSNNGEYSIKENAE